MCGIVLAGGNLSGSDLDIFNQLLYCDVFRGVHATGVFCKRLDKTEASYVKMATPSYAFLLDNDYREMSRGNVNGTYATPPNWLVGHNRHATRGNASDSKNAHPFQHGHITMVHNGTLTDQSLLPEHRRFEVDSDNIAFALSTWGVDRTIQNLDGAFTLIWHDNSDDTLHIIRNDERPFHLARVGKTDWFGASEEDMLMWILKRSKTHKNRIEEHFECKEGVEYIFDVSGKTRKMVLVEEKKHTLPVFSQATNWASYYNRGSYYSSSASSTALHSSSAVQERREDARKAERARQNQIAVDAGLKARVDGIIMMTPHTFVPYSGALNKGKGKITGYVWDEEANEYFEVDVHQASEEMFKDSQLDQELMIRGTIASMNKVDGMIRMIMTGPSLIHPAVQAKLDEEQRLKEEKEVEEALAILDKGMVQDDDIPFDTDEAGPEEQIMPNGVRLSKKFWFSHDHGKCDGCNKQIAWKDAPKAVFAHMSYWHPECLAKYTGDSNLGKNGMEETFICACCTDLKYMSELCTSISTERQEEICDDCARVIIEKRKANAGSTAVAVLGAAVGSVNCKVYDLVNQSRVDTTFYRKEFNRMILMAESCTKGIKFEDLPNCYVELRRGGVYAYAKLPAGTQVPAGGLRKEKEVVLEKAPVFRQPLSKTLKTGSTELTVTKALWATLGFCEHCYAPIPWKDVENCALAPFNRIVCPSCRGK